LAALLRLKKWKFVVFSFLAIGSMLVDIVQAQMPEQSIPATSNVSGAQYPRILPDHQVIFQINALDARKVQIDPGGVA